MLFTSYAFPVFVFGALCAYYAVGRITRNHGPQNLTLVLSGYLFYALWDWRWCGLLALVTLSGWLGGRLLTRGCIHARLVVAAVAVSNLAVLGMFKYFQFFADSLRTLLTSVGLRADEITLGLVLPVGVSYYVFQNLSYVFDAYRGAITHASGLLNYSTALSFFPQLLAGPITRPLALLPQLAERREFNAPLAKDGLRQILWGLTKKMLIADTIGARVDSTWANLESSDGLSLALTAVLYSVQIYCDFSGYADIAIGTAKLFNLRLAKNFSYPYMASSVRDFWRRWHMTLSSWMRDYVYIPLGGNRVGTARRHLNVMLTFAAVGLWHGANWTFIVWGALHGAYLVMEGWFQGRTRPAAMRPRWVAQVRTAARAVVVFIAVTVAWIFFRAPSLGTAFDYFGQALAAPLAREGYGAFVPSLAFAAALLVYEWLTRRWDHGLSIARLPLPARWALYLAFCVALLVAGDLGGREGIYVQF